MPENPRPGPMRPARGCCSPVRRAWSELCGRAEQLFPCLCDPTGRASWGLRATLVAIHVASVGVLVLLDADLIRKTKKEPWYTAMYLVLFVATLVQYFLTSFSSPGYVIDAMRAATGTDNNFISSKMPKQPASRNGSSVSSALHSQLERSSPQMNSSLWLKIVTDLYPPGSSSRSWTCTYCNLIQPPRSKHCHDCDKCVLQFDHHCVWLGTCIGQGNHCRFWWYIFEETILCTWTIILYIAFLQSKITKSWWEDAIGIIFLAFLIFCIIFLLLLLFFQSYLVLTNQTTYELARRRRILYLRGVPERTHPFSKGICRNLYKFCCSKQSVYTMEAVPTPEELQARARPYTCLDIISCRCC